MTILFIPYHGLFLCEIQVFFLRMEINQYNLIMATHYDIYNG